MLVRCGARADKKDTFPMTKLDEPTSCLALYADGRDVTNAYAYWVGDSMCSSLVCLPTLVTNIKVREARMAVPAWGGEDVSDGEGGDSDVVETMRTMRLAARTAAAEAAATDVPEYASA